MEALTSNTIKAKYDYSKQAKKQVISYQSADVWVWSIVVGIIIHYALDDAVGTTFCRKVYAYY